MNRLAWLGAVALIWGGLAGGSAQADTITVLDNELVGGVVTTREVATVSVTGANLAGWLEDGSVSETQTFAFPIGATELDEVTQLNLLAGTNFVATDAAKTDLPQTDPVSFDVSTEYFSIKIDGPEKGTAYFHWTDFIAGTTIEVTYDGVDGIGAGASHVTQYVPFPVAGAGLPGLVLACGGLLALARRRRHLVAA
jgi:hypothetical protein